MNSDNCCRGCGASTGPTKSGPPLFQPLEGLSETTVHRRCFGHFPGALPSASASVEMRLAGSKRSRALEVPTSWSSRPSASRQDQDLSLENHADIQHAIPGHDLQSEYPPHKRRSRASTAARVSEHGWILNGRRCSSPRPTAFQGVLSLIFSFFFVFSHSDRTPSFCCVTFILFGLAALLR